MTVQDAMMSPAVTVPHDSSALSALKLLIEKGISGAPVVLEHSSLVGVVTEFDLLLAGDHVGEHGPISVVMTPGIRWRSHSILHWTRRATCCSNTTGGVFRYWTARRSSGSCPGGTGCASVPDFRPLLL